MDVPKQSGGVGSIASVPVAAEPNFRQVGKVKPGKIHRGMKWTVMSDRERPNPLTRCFDRCWY